jgi:hypothetical protein
MYLYSLHIKGDSQKKKKKNVDTDIMRGYVVGADGYVSLCLGGSPENVKNILRGNICVIRCI